MHLLLFVNANYTQQFVEFLRALRIGIIKNFLILLLKQIFNWMNIQNYLL